MLARTRIATTSVLIGGATFIAATAFLAGGSASGQTVEYLVQRFRGECLPQYPQFKGEELKRHVRECISAKFVATARSMARQPVSSRSELKLVETSPWLCAPNRGPAEAKGIIYFVRGYGTAIDTFVPIPYFVKTLSDRGWDTLTAKIPRNARAMLGAETVGPGAAFLRRRLSELKSQGYKRVVLIGHSWGGWAALLAAHTPDFGAEVLLLSAPGTFGQRTSSRTGGPNAVFGLNLSEFPWALNNVKTPTVLILPDDTVYEPDAARRGAMAEKHFEEAKVPHLIITKPKGFTGHLAAWLPVFDFAFGRCVEAFIDEQAIGPCTLPPLSNDDFRSIVGIEQLANADKAPIGSAAPLVGKKFVAYSLAADSVNHHYEYLSPTQRRHTESDTAKSEGVAFRKDLHCVGNQCSKLIRWNDEQLLEFEAKSGKLAAWWVEQR
jgi:pimeloyl-ACP methyl ester carboxylesterase